MTRTVPGTQGSAKGISVADAAVAARMAVLAFALPILTRCLSLPSLVRFLDSRGRREPSGDPQRCLRLARAVLGRRVGPLRPGCYRRSLILFHTLRRRGHPVRVVFGIAAEGDGIDGHSWLELDGEPFAEEADPRGAFNVVYAYPPTRHHEELAR